MIPKLRSAFTLIELLIVVAIIAILAAIAVPNFLEAQVRSKVSRVKSDQRTVATALEAYAVDYNRYPRHYWPIGTTFLATQSNLTLTVLTTPVAFISSIEALRDPFLQNISVIVGPGLPGAGTQYEMDYQSYQTYDTFATDYTSVTQSFSAWCLWSYGPDQAEDAIQFRMFNYAVNPNPFTLAQYVLGIYDPTNGTISGGDIARFGGAVPAVASMAQN